MPELRRFACDPLPSEALSALDADGAVILRGLMDAAGAAALAAELAPHLRAPAEGSAAYGGGTRHATGLLAKSAAYGRLASHPALLAACEARLKPHCFHYQLHASRAFMVDPGAAEQELHREAGLFVHLPLPRPELLIGVIVAAGPFNAQNGATRVVPGSQRWEPGRRARPEEVAVAEMEAGDGLLFSGEVLHAAGANRSAAPRLGVLASYSLGWLRQEENQYLSLPPERALALPESLRRLAGYRRHAPQHGYADADPALTPVD